MRLQVTPDNRRRGAVPEDEYESAFRAPHPGGVWPTHRGRELRRRHSAARAKRDRMLARRARRRGKVSA